MNEGIGGDFGYRLTLYTICGIYMQSNSLPAGGAVGAGEIEVSPATLYTKQSSSHKCSFIRHYILD